MVEVVAVDLVAAMVLLELLIQAVAEAVADIGIIQAVQAALAS